MAKNSRSIARVRRHVRVRKNLTGTTERPRLNVFKSLSGIYAQVIDDQAGRTLISASSTDRELREKMKGLEESRTGETGRSDTCRTRQGQGHSGGCI